MFPRAALVGLGAGLVAALFRATLNGADAVRNQLLIWSHHFPVFGWIFPILFSMAGAIASLMLVQRYAPEASGSGIPHLEAVMHRLRTLNWKRVRPVKFIAGALAIGGGLALGREGPTVQMGASIGDTVSRWTKLSPGEKRTLIAAGGGAGLAAAFNAPLAGVIFVLEEIRRDFHPIVFGAAFVAVAIADIVVRFLFGGVPVFAIPNYPTPPLASLPIFAILGILAGLLGVAFNRALLGTMDLFAGLQSRLGLGIVAAVGAIAGLIGWFSPIAVGDGHALAEIVLAGEFRACGHSALLYHPVSPEYFKLCDRYCWRNLRSITRAWSSAWPCDRSDYSFLRTDDRASTSGLRGRRHGGVFCRDCTRSAYRDCADR